MSREELPGLGTVPAGLSGEIPFIWLAELCPIPWCVIPLLFLPSSFWQAPNTCRSSVRDRSSRSSRLVSWIRDTTPAWPPMLWVKMTGTSSCMCKVSPGHGASTQSRGCLSKSRAPQGSLVGAEKGEQEKSLTLLENCISSAPGRAGAVDAPGGRCPCSPQLSTACPCSAPHLPAANKPQRSP